MRPDIQSVCYSINTRAMNSQGDSNVSKNTRRKIQDKFDNDCDYSVSSNLKSNVERGWNSFSITNVSVPRIHPSRVLRSGANTLSRTLNSVQTTFGTLSQKFRRSTRRRYRFKNESPCSPITPQTRSRHILGRTPTKLYSPFGIESPCKMTKGKENGGDSVHYTPKKRSSNKSRPALAPPLQMQRKCDYGNTCLENLKVHRYVKESHCQRSPEMNHAQQQCLYGPRCQFSCEVEETRISMWEFGQTARNIVRSSRRH